MDYYGWIPCVAGELQFNLTFPELAERDIVNINYAPNSACSASAAPSKSLRYIVATSVYDWQDSKDRGLEGAFRILYCAYTQDRNGTTLAGRLYLIPVLNKNSALELPDPEISLLKAVKQIDEMAQKTYSHNSFEGASPKKIEKENRELDKAIHQDIPALISKIRDTKFVAEIDTLVDSSGLTKLSAHFPPNNQDSSEEDRFTVCRQAFYYIKYLLHRHSHHDSGIDSLTTIYRASCGSELAYYFTSELKRALVHFKRAETHAKEQAAGVALYAKSLVGACERNYLTGSYSSSYILPRISPDKAKAEYLFLENLQNSLALLDKKSKYRSKAWDSTFILFFQILSIFFLFSTPLIFGAVRTLDPNELPIDSSLTGILNWYGLITFVSTLLAFFFKAPNYPFLLVDQYIYDYLRDRAKVPAMLIKPRFRDRVLFSLNQKYFSYKRETLRRREDSSWRRWLILLPAISILVTSIFGLYYCVKFVILALIGS